MKRQEGKADYVDSDSAASEEISVPDKNGFRFEFDPVNKILLLRLDGRQTDESLERYPAIREYSTATDAQSGILGFSFIAEFDASTEFIRYSRTSGTSHARRDQEVLAFLLPQERRYLVWVACFGS